MSAFPRAAAPWAPLAQGALRQRAWDALADIAAECRALRLGPAATIYPGLAGGDAGLAVFFHSLHAATGLHEDRDAARLLLLRAAGAMPLPGPSFCLFRGAPGVAWALAHLRADGSGEGGEPEIRAVDHALLDAARAGFPGGGYDLARGVVGLGVYALERLPAPAAAEALAAAVARLDQAAQHTAEGATWFKAPGELLPWQRDRFPRGVYDLGMAHGAAGVIALLARAVAAGVAAERASRLVHDAVRWVRAQELPAHAPSRYPARILPGETPQPARLAWCYGDPGMGLALLAAARVLADAELEAHARAVLRAAASRAPGDSGVADAPFCHGAAGVAHLFHRAWRATGEEPLREAALRWLDVALEVPAPETGIPRFAFRVVHEGTETWSPRTGVLEGMAGVGLVLLAAVSPAAPAWDRMFLADVEPAAAASRLAPPATPGRAWVPSSRSAAPGHAGHTHDPPPTQDMDTAAPDPVAPAQLITRAAAIADELLGGAQTGPDGALTWNRGYALGYVPAEDAGMFSGRIGEALFLAALFATTGDPRHEEAALRASQALRAGAAAPAYRERLAGEVGYGLTGVGSQVYALVRMSQFLNRPGLLEDATLLSQVLTPGRIGLDRVHDVFWGAAGAALGLLALYDHTGDPAVLERAVACGDHLLARRGTDPETGLRAWATLDPALSTGFAHGSSGIAHALLRLHQCTGEPRFYDAAVEAFAWERTLFREDIQDWPDMRDQPADRPLLSSWCHGAPGMALARLAALYSVDESDEGDVVADLDRALTRASESPIQGSDNLCCGNFGRIDILLEAGRILENDSLVRQARSMAGTALRRADEQGWALPAAHEAHERHLDAGLWQGLAGVGYALLRLADPDQYPSLLAWS